MGVSSGAATRAVKLAMSGGEANVCHPRTDALAQHGQHQRVDGFGVESKIHSAPGG